VNKNHNISKVAKQSLLKTMKKHDCDALPRVCRLTVFSQENLPSPSRTKNYSNHNRFQKEFLLSLEGCQLTAQPLTTER
jgi:hypothetical protein